MNCGARRGSYNFKEHKDDIVATLNDQFQR